MESFRPGRVVISASAPANLELPVRVKPDAWVAYCVGVALIGGAWVYRLVWPQ
jgi:hypothetical protein